LAGEIIDEFGDDLVSITLVRGDGGRFEVDVDGRSVFSKRASGRHPNPNEVVENIAQLGSGTDDGGAEDDGRWTMDDGVRIAPG
jgi:selenoprotein W-related protein